MKDKKDTLSEISDDISKYLDKEQSNKFNLEKIKLIFNQLN